jgi:hypothetical protein
MITTALLLSLVVGQAEKADKPVELTPAEIKAFYDPKLREDVLKKYDGMVLKLSGTVKGYDKRFEFEFPNKPKSADRFDFTIQLGDDSLTRDTRTVILKNSANGHPTKITVYGVAKFSRVEEVVKKEYVVPDELKPKNKPPLPGFESLQGTSERAMIEMALNSERLERIMKDARSKGMTEKATVYQVDSPVLAGASVSLKNVKMPNPQQ